MSPSLQGLYNHSLSPCFRSICYILWRFPINRIFAYNHSIILRFNINVAPDCRENYSQLPNLGLKIIVGLIYFELLYTACIWQVSAYSEIFFPHVKIILGIGGCLFWCIQTNALIHKLTKHLSNWTKHLKIYKIQIRWDKVDYTMQDTQHAYVLPLSLQKMGKGDLVPLKPLFKISVENALNPLQRHKIAMICLSKECEGVAVGCSF